MRQAISVMSIGQGQNGGCIFIFQYGTLPYKIRSVIKRGVHYMGRSRGTCLFQAKQRLYGKFWSSSRRIGSLRMLDVILVIAWDIKNIFGGLYRKRYYFPRITAIAVTSCSPYNLASKCISTLYKERLVKFILALWKNMWGSSTWTSRCISTKPRVSLCSFWNCVAFLYRYCVARWAWLRIRVDLFQVDSVTWLFELLLM